MICWVFVTDFGYLDLQNNRGHAQGLYSLAQTFQKKFCGSTYLRMYSINKNKNIFLCREPGYETVSDLRTRDLDYESVNQGILANQFINQPSKTLFQYFFCVGDEWWGVGIVEMIESSWLRSN